MYSTEHQFNCSIPVKAGTNNGRLESPGSEHTTVKRYIYDRNNFQFFIEIKDKGTEKTPSPISQDTQSSP